jgi:hypothetical protein
MEYIAIGFLALVILLFLATHSSISERKLKSEFSLGDETDNFSLFLNFNDSSKHFYYSLRNTFSLDGVPYGRLVSYKILTRTLKVRSIGQNAQNYYFTRYRA